MPSSLDAGTRRAVGTALARAAVPLVCLDTSIELAQPFDRELSAALELACEWGAPAVRVFGGASESSMTSRDGSSPCWAEPRSWE